MLDTVEQEVVPFLKWAGGKRWLTAQYDHVFPSKFGRYIEPFLGGAAVFFHLRPDRAILSDKNGDLINVYSQIKKDWRAVYSALKRHNQNHSSSYYYEERSRQRRAAHERAAQFLYLNRTCWNGLYRVNLRGEFNVPIGTKDTVLLDTDDFEASAELLTTASLRVSDFEPILDEARKNDFVFIDPPYVTRHNFNGFVKYNDKIFQWKDQERLAAAIQRAAKKGAMILLTNADHASVKALYKNLDMKSSLRSLQRASVLAADSANRGAVSEMVLAINFIPGSK